MRVRPAAVAAPAFILAVFLLLPLSAFAQKDPPEVIGAFRLRMTIAEAKAASPGLSVAENTTADGQVAALDLAEAKSTGQRFGELEGCDLTLRFLKQQLVTVQGRCAVKEATEAYLLKTHGQPGSKGDEAWEWIGEQRSMTYVPTSGVFLVADNAGNAALQAMLFKLLFEGEAAPTHAPPAAGQP